MASPVNIGDAIAILVSIYKAYDAYKSTPDELRQKLRRFESTEKECKALNKVLATSQREVHRTWPFTADLVADLKKARDFFQQFEPLTDDHGNVKMIAKVKKLVKVRWDWSEVEKHVKTVDMHRKDMRDFKQNVLIQAVNDSIKLQLQMMRSQHGQQEGVSANPRDLLRVDAISIASDRMSRMSVLTKVTIFLDRACELRPEPSRRHEVPLSPIIEDHQSSTEDNPPVVTNDLKRSVADFIESKQLHKPDSLQIASLQDLEYIAELPTQWQQLQLSRQESPVVLHERRNPTSLLPRTTIQSSPPVLAPIPARNDDAISISPSWNMALERAQYGSMHIGLTTASSTITLPEPALSLEQETLSDKASSVGSTTIEGVEQPIEGVMIHVPFFANPMQCRLRMIQSEGSLCVQSTTVDRFHGDFPPTLDAVTPFSLLRVSDRDEDESHSGGPSPLIFNHAVMAGISSFPKVLHPGGETGTLYPYIIDFYQHQYIQVEGYPKLPRAVKGLSYAFKEKSDRDLVRQRIFGKRLLASAGTATIKFDTKSVPKPCQAQSTSLWRGIPSTADTSDTAGHTNDLTVTIHCSTEGHQTADTAIELRISKLNLENLDAVKENEGKVLKLRVFRVEPEQQLDHQAPVASGGLLTNTTTSSTSNSSNISSSSTGAVEGTMHSSPPSRIKSWLSSGSRRSSVASLATTQQSALFQAYITFMEGSNGLTSAKNEFLDALKENIGY